MHPLKNTPISKHFFILLFAFLAVIKQSNARDWVGHTIDDSLPKEAHFKDLEGTDLTDVILSILHKPKIKVVTDSLSIINYNYSLVPAAGYTLQTGFAGIISANLGFYNYESANAKISNIASSLTYSQYKQIILPLTANIWFNNGRYNFVSDNRYISYPSSIYGLGGRTDPNKARTINFSGLKLHNKLVRSFSKNWMLGLGVYYDQFWNIKVLDPTTNRISNLIQRELGTTETSVGSIVNIMYDARTNQINPDKGSFLNIVLRNNFRTFGSDNDWQSLIIDTRKYISLPRGSRNVLALWSLEWLTLGGNIPYLSMPSTGWDDQYNTGRGYIQSRFRGRSMSYLESEYRFAISRNGLFGGVVFANVQSFSGELSKTYTTLLPGYGAGIRMKINKHSRTNICIDYGIGKNGTGGFYVNLGEVF